MSDAIVYVVKWIDNDGIQHCVARAALAGTSPTPPTCKHGDPACPCPDGDPCHYEGDGAFPSPMCNAAHAPTPPTERTCTCGHAEDYHPPGQRTGACNLCGCVAFFPVAPTPMSLRQLCLALGVELPTPPDDLATALDERATLESREVFADLYQLCARVLRGEEFPPTRDLAALADRWDAEAFQHRIRLARTSELSGQYLLGFLNGKLEAARDLRAALGVPRSLSADHNALADLVSEQAEDEGLWFAAETASEGYLQQELRRLHAAAEAALGVPRSAGHEEDPVRTATPRTCGVTDRGNRCGLDAGHGGHHSTARKAGLNIYWEDKPVGGGPTTEPERALTGPFDWPWSDGWRIKPDPDATGGDNG